MPFDTNTSATTVYDYSGKGNDGTVNGGQDADSGFTSNGKYGGAEMFDGNGDYVITSGFSLASTSGRTACAWIYPKAHTNNYAAVVRKAGDISLRLTTGGILNERVYNSVGSYSSAYSSATSIPTNSWSHVCVIFESPGAGSNITLKFYLNATLDLDQTTDLIDANGLVGSGSNAIRIGSDQDIASRIFNGSIDEVMIFNTSLTQAQITDIYNNQSARFKSSGNQTYKFQNITSGGNEYNLTAYFQNEKGSNVSARVGHWDVEDGYLESDFSGENGLVSYWHFDEESWSGVSADVIDSVGGNDGTSSGNANTTSDSYMFGNVGEFDGDGDYVNLDSTIALGTNWSISVWAYIKSTIHSSLMGDSTSSYGYINLRTWSGGNGIIIETSITNSNEIIVCVDEVSINEWDYYNIVKNGTQVSCYKNGLFIDSDSFSIEEDLNIDYIGKGYSTYLFNGTIDDVMIFNRSLSAEEIKELYIKGRVDWVYSDYKNLSSSGGMESFVIDMDATHVLQDFKFLAGSDAFYSPLLSTIETSGARVNFSLNISDVGVPQANITYPLNGTNYSNYVTGLNYTTEGLDYCWYGNGSWNSSAVSVGTNWTGLNGNSSLGSNVWYLYCNDSAGNENSTSVTFEVDDVPSEVAVNLPLNGTRYNTTTVLINASATDVTGNVSLFNDYGLVSWWRMDDLNATGGVVDYMGLNNGTAVGNAVQTDSGKLGKAFSFGNEGFSYLNVSPYPALDITNEITLSAWVKNYGVGSHYKMIVKPSEINNSEWWLIFSS